MQTNANALETFDSTLIALLHEVDHLLEQRYRDRFIPHPARPAYGTTASPQYDGLFTLQANFTAGIGSRYGAGYALSLRIATLMPIDPALKEECETTMVQHLLRRLPEVFPTRALSIDKDLYGWKLHGDLSIR
jgi:hypothetical protein